MEEIDKESFDRFQEKLEFVDGPGYVAVEYAGVLTIEQRAVEVFSVSFWENEQTLARLKNGTDIP